MNGKELRKQFKCVPATVELFDQDDFKTEFGSHVVDANFGDSQATAFFERQLLYILQKTVDTKQQVLKAAMLFPVSREVDPGADTFAYQGYTMYGHAKAISDYANDFPRADVYGEEKTANVRSYGTSYGWSVQELRRNALAGKTGRNPRLPERKAAAARRAADEVVNTVALKGDKKNGIEGFIDYPGITKAINPVGAGAGTAFATKTPDEIIATFSVFFNSVSVPTNGVEVPNAIIMPLEEYNYLRRVRLTDTGMSLLSYLAENFPEITSWEWLQELAGAGEAADDRMMAYRKDPMNLELHMPLPFTTYTAQVKGLEWVIPCEVRTGGVVVYYPLSVAYMDGI